MSTGLLALLDDVVALAKKAAIVLDDTAALSLKAGSKSVGVVADDAAVTPKYIIGFAASRELPIIFRITLGSLRNKFLFVLPAVLALGWFAPWVITPLLVAGAMFLAFEGFEKVHEWFTGHGEEETPLTAEDVTPEKMAEFERRRVNSAIRTDLILSAEIMVIAYAELVDEPFLYQLVALSIVAVGITLLVYGVVALIVKMDDIGLWLAVNEDNPRFLRRLGRGIVRAMPAVLKGLSVLGTVAMLWVAGGIIVHALAEYGIHAPEHWGEAVPVAGPLLVSIGLGLLAGAVVWGLLTPFLRFLAARREDASREA
jgi:hypothetical protein